MGKTLAGEDQLVKLFNDRHLNVIRLAVTAGVVVGRTEQIGIEHARNAVLAQQNKRIRQRFEPGFYWRFQCLQRLGVVVSHQGDGVERVRFNQGCR
ncbi:Uncharacterised protein [Enterobacter cancerogenus]|uniref:Uncharacterized protein n=1 Tax=Enterobacter cancerogenus TaxID=69218 RepID=A0A484Y3S1_9ENTR|nr:Uncharacterised protein [Enterobacter cancerogenus]